MVGGGKGVISRPQQADFMIQYTPYSFSEYGEFMSYSEGIL